MLLLTDKPLTIFFTRNKFITCQLARDMGISRPLLYLHLKKLEEANLIQGHSEILESDETIKFG